MRRTQVTLLTLALLIAGLPALATETDVAEGSKPATSDNDAKKPDTAKAPQTPQGAQPPPGVAAPPQGAAPSGKDPAATKGAPGAAAVDARFNTLEDIFGARLAPAQAVASTGAARTAEVDVAWREVE